MSHASSLSPGAALVDPFPSVDLTVGHSAWRQQVRAFVAKHLTPQVVEACESQERVPRELIQASYEAGIYAARAPAALGGTPPSSLPAGARFDATYEMILVEELSACAAQGVVMELLGNFAMILPLMDAFASAEMRAKIIRPMVRAEVFCSFALTEPVQLQDQSKSASLHKSKPAAAPGDSAVPASSSSPRSPSAGRRGPRLRTTATRQPDGSFVVTGEKMYISYGARADYVLTACTIVEATAGVDAPPAPMSLLLIPAKSLGVTITPMRLHGWRAHSTTRMRFQEVAVPANLLLVDGRQSSAQLMALLFSLLQSNTTGERFFTAIMAQRSARICLDDSIAFARAKTIGARGEKRLIDSSAVRHTLVQMAVAVQANRLMLEELARQTASEQAAAASESDSSPTLPFKQSKALAQQTALVKYACVVGLKQCAQSAVTILGASSVAVGSGPGARVERIERDAKVNATAGSSENTLLEFVAKQAKL